MSDYIVVDKKVAGYFMHEMSHLDLHFVPKEIRQMQFALTTGQRTIIDALIEQAQGRIAKLGGYLEAAIKAPKDA